MLAELGAAHPDLRSLATRVEIQRYGHAMVYPRPGLLRANHAMSGALNRGRLSFAHADWSGYSIFEEAFSRGHFAAQC